MGSPGWDENRIPGEDFRLAGRGELALRPYLADRALAVLARITAEVADPGSGKSAKKPAYILAIYRGSVVRFR